MRIETHTPTRPRSSLSSTPLPTVPAPKLTWNRSSPPALPFHPVPAFFLAGAVAFAARLLFRQWHEVLDAVAFFWACRLDGSHHLTPIAASALPLPSNRDDLSTRLKYLFAARACELLEIDDVHRWRKKARQLSEEIEGISTAMRKRRRLLVFEGFQQKMQELEAEWELIEKRLQEFQAAIYSVMFQLDGTGWEKNYEKIAVFELGGGLDWEWIHHVMVRECRRLDEGLPIIGGQSYDRYGHNRYVNFVL
ncbi:hypothetical protein ACLOJK_013489 [Asimina triloba]